MGEAHSFDTYIHSNLIAAALVYELALSRHIDSASGDLGRRLAAGRAEK